MKTYLAVFAVAVLGAIGFAFTKSSSVEATDKQEILMQALESLDEKDLEVISYRFGVNGKSQKTLDETGAEMDLTRDQVRYAQMKALTKMRDLLTARSIEIDDLLLL